MPDHFSKGVMWNVSEFTFDNEGNFLSSTDSRARWKWRAL